VYFAQGLVGTAYNYDASDETTVQLLGNAAERAGETVEEEQR